MTKDQRKNLFELFIYLFILLNPLIDALTCIQIKNNINFISISSLTRGVFFLIIFIYLLTTSKSKKDYIFLSLYFLIQTIIQYLLIHNSLSYEIANLMQIFYLPILINFFKKHQNRYLNLKTICYLYLIYLNLIIIPYIFHFGYYANEFYQEKEGYYGLFYGANEISAILVIMLPLVISYLKEHQNIILTLIIFLELFISIYFIGTKTSLLGVLIVLSYFIIPYVVKIFRKLTKVKKIIAITSMTLLTLLLISLIPLTPLYKNILRAIDFFNISSSNFFSYYGLNKIIFSGRLEFLTNIFNIYKSSNFLTMLFGLGKTKLISLKLIEIDIFDTFFSIGLIGFIIYIISIIKSLKNTKLNKITTFTLLLGLVISLIAGHILTAPNVSIYLALLFFFNRKNAIDK